MSKIRLFVRLRKQGARIESVAFRRLIVLSGRGSKSWTFEVVKSDDGVILGGWLILSSAG